MAFFDCYAVALYFFYKLEFVINNLFILFQ